MQGHLHIKKCTSPLTGSRDQRDKKREGWFGGLAHPLSNDWYRGPTKLVQHFRLKEFTSAQELCLTFSLNGLAISLAYCSGEDGGNVFVQIICTYCLCAKMKGMGSAPCGLTPLAGVYPYLWWRRWDCCWVQARFLSKETKMFFLSRHM